MDARKQPWRRISHVGRADFRQRIRSRKVLAVLAVIAYLGYLVNVGSVEIFYQDSSGDQLVQYTGEPTSAYVGLTAGVTGATVLFLTGYYLLGGSLERDQRTDVDRLVASTGISTRELLLGKWLSHVGYVGVVLGTLGTAAVINHLIHGTGTTDPIWILGPIFLLGVPVGCLVAGVTLLFQSTDRFSGTVGNVTYFLAATITTVAVLATTDGYARTEIPLWLRLSDTIGMLVTADLTYDALRSVWPGYDGTGIASFGAGASSAEIVRFHWDGSAWPLWFYANRTGLAVLGLVLTAVAAVPYDRFDSESSSDGKGLVARVRHSVPSIRSDSSGEAAVANVGDTTLTPVTDRTAGGLGRLVLQELRLLVRGQPWWWYAGAAVIGIVGITGSAATEATVTVAAMWPIFLWSSMGSRPSRHRMMPFIVSSKQPYGQLVAEWIAGVIVAVAFFGVSLWPAVADTGAGGAVVLIGAVLFAPSLAQALGYWSGTRRLFELAYLLLWYIGPLNQVPRLDFAGATSKTIGTTTPLVFGGIGLAALVAAFTHRYRKT
ncbi:hypothetical protein CHINAEXTREME_08040 [Halobiforma lacisalsi AJ5]|uniref:Uncharacterized protein n=1 Tax=Natronobacterium lacisalsi AJ5 TaxID=358396 RepID=M0LYX3_NATLA|nr:hypothetical protein [Halobiforma lacisalsi]APW97728.1 hypothetical protein CHINAEXTREME_08040 [Halobiforma lacisalsi AJ5]EMA37529.1 hypothetical protein C445_01541 [Halobiforma lacisalsi AJ5]